MIVTDYGGPDQAWPAPGPVQTPGWPSDHGPDATVVIVTRNRAHELRTALESVQLQQGCVLEVIVVDDASSDDTVAMILSEFPWVRLYRSPEAYGCSVQRNFAAGVALAPLLVSIDDDARLPDPNIIVETMANFTSADIGAVAMPYRDRAPDGTWQTMLSRGSEGAQIIECFTGTAYAVRRDVFRSIGGFWSYSGTEERDFCIRMLEAGYFVRVGTAQPLEHLPSPVRNMGTKAFRRRRGDIVFSFRNVPTAMLTSHLFRTTFGGVRAVMESRGRHARESVRGYLQGWRQARPAARRPVSREVYSLSVRLRRHGALSLEDGRQVRGDLSPR